MSLLLIVISFDDARAASTFNKTNALCYVIVDKLLLIVRIDDHSSSSHSLPLLSSIRDEGEEHNK